MVEIVTGPISPITELLTRSPPGGLFLVVGVCRRQKERGRLQQPLSPTVKFIFRKNFPAHSTDPWFQTKTAHDVLQQRVLTTRACQHRSNFDLIGVVQTIAFQRLEEQRLSAQGFKQKSAHVGSLVCPGTNPEEITNFHVGSTGSPL